MRCRSAVVVGALFLSFSLAGCATAASAGGIAAPAVTIEPAETSEPAVTDTEAAAAHAQAQAWLDAAALPPGAVRSDTPMGGFNSYTGWPCGPYEELKAYWTIPGATAPDTANWLIEHPTANLISTTHGPVSAEWNTNGAIVGFIPAPDAQEGIVYTIEKTADGVKVRAEIAAQTESAVCPPLPDGSVWGAPGQG